MRQNVILSIRGTHTYLDQEPEVIELVTDGVLESTDLGWKLSYEESDLTGMAGVTTTFTIEPQKIILNRTGKLSSEMIFQEGIVHESLYKVEFGALMISVCASKISTQLSEKGGIVGLTYSIEIEQSSAGTIEYHLEIRPK